MIHNLLYCAKLYIKIITVLSIKMDGSHAQPPRVCTCACVTVWILAIIHDFHLCTDITMIVVAFVCWFISENSTRVLFCKYMYCIFLVSHLCRE